MLEQDSAIVGIIATVSVLLFLAITFGLTWGLASALLLFPDTLTYWFGPLEMTNPLFLLAVYAPAIAAFTLIGREAGVSGCREFVRRLALWRCHWLWYLFIIAGIPLLMWLAALLKGPVDTVPFDTWQAGLTALGITLIVGPVEEFGWRGVLLPLLQRRLAPIYAGLTLGVIWGIWHLPAFLLSGTPQSNWDILPYMVALLSISVIMTALFNASEGSLLLAVLVHYQLNNPLLPDGQPYDTLTFTLAALLVIWIYRRPLFSRSASVTSVFHSPR